ncbi:hypothetical protein ACFPOD_00765 [Nitratireductor kimnyeongensis]|uniref:J domain-containing protein n=1 Tax=Nitratireductor kimnyeongensis TaxID=430679 RepID=A0ABW0T2V7_9HYPH|nr:hypothetical protein [Nitratireductor kimnyeongensis]QZZ35317.1 hypothetical protein KW403_16430 [Nitratireductor kimnyeongensis]
MAIGRSRDFAALLDELIDEDARNAGGSPATLHSLDYLSVAEELHSGRINFTDRRAEAEYGMHQSAPPRRRADQAKTVKTEPPVAMPLATDPDEIARELGLGRTTDPKVLDRLRRDFAFRNHPDRVPAHLRANAMTRMQVANMLIDEAKRGKIKPQGAGEARA